MTETHHNSHDGCLDCLEAEKNAYEEGLMIGGFNLGIEMAVKLYEALPAVRQARRDGTLAQCFTDLLAGHTGKWSDRMVKALATALEKMGPGTAGNGDKG